MIRMVKMSPPTAARIITIIGTDSSVSSSDVAEIMAQEIRNKLRTNLPVPGE